MKMKKLKKTEYLPYMFIFIAVVNLAVMIITFTRYGAMIFEYRYHIIWGAMLLLMAVSAIDALEHIRLKNVVLLAMVFMVVLINYGGFNHIFEETSLVTQEKEVIRVAEENDIDTIYVYDMMASAAAIRVLDVDRNCMSVICNDGVVSAETDNFYDNYSSYYTFSDKNIFVCTPDKFEVLPDAIKDCYSELDTLDIGCVYVGYENPWLDGTEP